jgi:hypothetical protein
MIDSKYPRKGPGSKVLPMSMRPAAVRPDPKHPLGAIKPAAVVAAESPVPQAPCANDAEGSPGGKA